MKWVNNYFIFKCMYRVCVCVCVDLGLSSGVFFNGFSAFSFEIRSLFKPRAQGLARLASQWALGVNVTPFLVLEFQMCSSMPGFYMGAGDPNPGSHACKLADALSSGFPFSAPNWVNN